MLTKAQKRSLLQIIQEQRREVETSIETLKGNLDSIAEQCRATIAHAMGEDGSTDYDKGVNFTQLEILAKRLQLLKMAETNFSTPGYKGTCASCRKPIPFERFQAIPETRVCIHCA